MSALWPLPLLLDGSTRNAAGHWVASQDLEDVEQLIRQAVVADLERTRPQLVLVERYPRGQAISKDVNLLEYLLQDPAFRTKWSKYRACGSAGSTEVFCLDSTSGTTR